MAYCQYCGLEWEVLAEQTETNTQDSDAEATVRGKEGMAFLKAALLVSLHCVRALSCSLGLSDRAQTPGLIMKTLCALTPFAAPLLALSLHTHRVTCIPLSFLLFPHCDRC